MRSLQVDLRPLLGCSLSSMSKKQAFAAALYLSAVLSMPAAAQTADEVSQLRRMVEDQRTHISDLEARLAVMERMMAATHPREPLAASAQPLHLPETAPTDMARARNQPSPLGRPLPSDVHPIPLDERLAQIEAAQKDMVHVNWSKGTPEFSSSDGNLTFRPRGRILIDLGNTSGSSDSSRNITATQARSLRLGMEGSIGRHLSYVLEGDFADNAVSIKSAYMAWTARLLGQQAEFALGNRLNDRSLDGSSGTISVPFIERNVVGQGIIPVRGFFGLGVAARVYGRNWHVGVQLSGDDITNPETASDGVTLAGRMHWNPVKTDDLILHLGVWGFYEHIAGDVTRPTRAIAIGGFFNDRLRVTPGTFADPNKGTGYGFEAGLFNRSLWAYGEFGNRRLMSETAVSTKQSAWAVAAGWFLTGETTPYLARGGIWSRPNVIDPLTGGGSGAFEIAVRYETIDYSDNPTGGRGAASTLGLNWYLNNFVRLQLNAIEWSVHNPSGMIMGTDHGRTVVTRAQISF
ncbi:porin [Sphingobium lactosutens]|nr:porin [Sphingobium lactosutens]